MPTIQFALFKIVGLRQELRLVESRLLVAVAS